MLCDPQNKKNIITWLYQGCLRYLHIHMYIQQNRKDNLKLLVSGLVLLHLFQNLILLFVIAILARQLTVSLAIYYLILGVNKIQPVRIVKYLVIYLDLEASQHWYCKLRLCCHGSWTVIVEGSLNAGLHNKVYFDECGFVVQPYSKQIQKLSY